MTTEIEKKFFEAFGIPKNVKKYRQYNFGRVPYGQKELKKSLDNGIECRYIKAEPSECSDCVYWTEIYYPEITDRILLELIVLSLNNDFVIHSKNITELQEKILYLLTQNANNKDMLYAVRKLFEVEEV